MGNFSQPVGTNTVLRAPSPANSGLAGAEVLSAIGTWSTIGGALMSGIGAYYGAKTGKEQARMQADSLRHQQNIANQNARQAEFDAQEIMRSAQVEKGKIQLQGRQDRSRTRTSTAARGGRVGTGSAAEIEVSQLLVQRMDELTIDSNAARGAADRRLRGASLRNEALLAGVSARNMDRSASSINPGLQAGTTLLGSAGIVSRQLADDVYRRQR